MSKSSNRSELIAANIRGEIKRKRTRTLDASDRMLWPEKDDSLFSNIHLVSLMANTVTATNLTNAISQSDNLSGGDSTDDSLFNNIDLSEVLMGNTETYTGSQFLARESNDASDDTLFADIDLNNVMGASTNGDIFVDVVRSPDSVVQNTQTFLHDVAFKIPQIPQLKSNKVNTQSSLSTQEGLVQGTQYETREQIQNRTQQMSLNESDALGCQEVADLSQYNWETQIFNEPTIYTFPSKGEFYGLPNRVKQLIFDQKGIKSLYEWQDECLKLPAISSRKNLIYALPTSGGKTLVAEILMLREIICRERNVLFILPYVSIVQEKVSALSPFAFALDFIVDEYTAGKGKCPPAEFKKRHSIFIASIEKGAILMDSLIHTHRVNEIGLVVVDELHLIGERGRGATLEAFLTKVMFLKVAGVQIVAMSATIGNLSEMSAFLDADVYTRGFRPVELKEYIKCGLDLLEINTTGHGLEEVFTYRRSVNFKYSDEVARCDPDHLAGLVSECAPENCCLIFCSTRKNCENVAMLLSRILPKGKFLQHRKSEKSVLMDAMYKLCGILSPIFAKTIPYGIAYHHSGLTTDERKYIETAYRFGVISVICCTSTLAAGVNLPAKRVIIRAPYVGTEFITLCKYKQMVGRAGRAGMGEAGESILISSTRDNVRIGKMLFSPMDKAISSLDFNGALGLQSLILSAIGLKLAACRSELSRLIGSTLLAVQSKDLGISSENMVLEVVREMFKNKVLQLAVDESGNSNEILTTQELGDGIVISATMQLSTERCIYISKSTRFQLTTIGKAAFRAGIDYKRASAICNELKCAQQQLILSSYAHLLYLLVCFNSNAKADELFPADASILFHKYSAADETTQMLFRQLGFNEAIAARIAKTMSVQGGLEVKLNRIFKVLILMEVLDEIPVPVVADRYKIERGTLQNLVTQTISAASGLVRLCEEVDEFWCYKPLFERVITKMDRCGAMELEPLLELPAVKINRAKQLYAAGFRTIVDIAKCRPTELILAVEHMPHRIAKEIISAAKNTLIKRLDHLEGETESLKFCLKSNDLEL